MRLRARHLPLLVTAGIGALLIGGPARSQSVPGGSIAVSDNQFRTTAGGAPAVTIAPGGMVTFASSGSNPHNVVFTSLQPSTCTQTAGAPSTGPVPPLPNPAQGAGWAGQCTFTAAGAYPFVCAVHSEMTGSVTVVGGTAPPPPAPPPPAPPAPAPPPPPPAAGPAASALRVSALQRGFAVRGSVQVTRASSRLLARAFARRGALYGGRSLLQVRVGRQLREPVGGRRVAFAVPLTALARRALRRNGRLAISLRLTVTPPTGTVYTATRTVILRAPL